MFNFNTYANENSKVRYIDVDFIFKNSIVGKKINNIAIKDREKKLEANKKIEKKLEDQKKDILSQQNILSEEEFQQKVLSHQKKFKNIKLKK